MIKITIERNKKTKGMNDTALVKTINHVKEEADKLTPKWKLGRRIRNRMAQDLTSLAKLAAGQDDE